MFFDNYYWFRQNDIIPKYLELDKDTSLIVLKVLLFVNILFSILQIVL